MGLLPPGAFVKLPSTSLVAYNRLPSGEIATPAMVFPPVDISPTSVPADTIPVESYCRATTPTFPAAFAPGATPYSFATNAYLPSGDITTSKLPSPGRERTLAHLQTRRGACLERAE